MLVADRIRNKALRRFAARGDESRLNADWVPRIRRILTQLNVAVAPGELNLPGLHWHELKGDRAGTWAVRVTGNWRITFRWDDAGPYAIDLEDYHA